MPSYTCQWICTLLSYIRTVAAITQEHFIWKHFNLCLPLGLISPWFCSLQQKAESKNTSARCLCCWFDKSSTLAEGEDTKVVATARGHLSGFAQRNLKHLDLFDHNLILKEATIYSMLAWYLSSDKLFLTHTRPWKD